MHQKPFLVLTVALAALVDQAALSDDRSGRILIDCPGRACPARTFVGDLILKDVAAEHVDSGVYDPGHTEFMILTDYSYVDSKERVWTVPSGTVVSGAVMPKLVYSTIGGPWSGSYRNAIVLLEYMVNEQVSDSETVYGVFLEAMQSSGVSNRTSLLLYYAIRSAGPIWVNSSSGVPILDYEGVEISPELIVELGTEVNEGITVAEIDERTLHRFR